MSAPKTGRSRPLVPPIVLSSTFEFDDADAMTEAALKPGHTPLYSRWSNPTVAAAENAIATLEGAERALVTSSGMSAIHIALIAALDVGHGEPGVLLCQREVYGGTHELVEHVLAPLGVRVQRAGLDDIATAAAALPPGSVIHLEMPTNPLIRVVDLPAVRAAAPPDTRLVVDATFATPVNFRALEQGADISVHSATKYLGGHHDVIAGSIAGSGELLRKAWTLRKLFGPVLDPAAAYRLWRGLETLELRVSRQNASALALSERLRSHSAVARVHYPGLSDHPDHAVAARLFTGAGGVLSFEVRGDDRAAARVVNRVETIARAASLGGVSSLVTWPAGVTHAGLTDEERAASGLSPNLLRLAVGVEAVETLWQDLSRALEALA
ncbi:MAG: aminotransferase class I/II-fold pyridoxal phosphate-dependent enzyme [Myxococcota bacterium]|nr:aminotransferase class I/II-fold pyridoxal phosphate-dependent enzyme [Myxococcota bacterium]